MEGLLVRNVPSWDDELLLGGESLTLNITQAEWENNNLTKPEDGLPSSTTTVPALEDLLVGLGVMDTNTIVMVVMFTLLIFVTMVGNLLVCLSVILVRKLRKPQNYLLMSLALSDLFVATFVMPFAIVFEVYEGIWPLNKGLCDLWVSADVLCCTASILNLCAISCDRYRAITSPLEYSARTTPKRILGMVFIVWLVSACVSLPPVLLLGNVHEDMHGQPFCSVSQNFWYQIYATMASFYVPLAVMFVVYFKILRVVGEKQKQMCWNRQFHHNSSIHRASSTTTSTIHSDQPLLMKKDSVISTNSVRILNARNSGTPLLISKGVRESSMKIGRHGRMEGHVNPTLVTTLGRGNSIVTTLSNPGHPKTKKVINLFPTTFRRLRKEKLFGGLKEHKASTVLGIIMSAFVICWLPFFILAILRPFLAIQNVEIPPWISSLFNWLGYFNSALNPLIYATLNRDFRRPFKEILCFRCATLNSLMRREFYNQQYGGDDKLNRRRRALALKAAEEQSITEGGNQPITFF